MESFYVVLPSDSSGNYFPLNTIANFRTKLASPIELENSRWEVGLVEISYPKGYKKKQLLHNIIRLDAMEIRFSVKNYKSLYELFVTLKRHFKSADEKENFVTHFNKYLNKHVPSDGYTTNILGVCYGQNSLKVGENLISHFPVRVYNGLEDLVATIMAPANCSSSQLSLPETDNSDFASPETIFVYTDIIKPNFVGDSYVRLLTPLHWVVQGSNPSTGETFCTIQDSPGAHPASFTMGTRSLLGVKLPKCGTDHPLPSSAEVKERVELIPLCPLCAIMACYRVNFIFTAITFSHSLYVCCISQIHIQMAV
jgi:hypothetical protein